MEEAEWGEKKSKRKLLAVLGLTDCSNYILAVSFCRFLIKMGDVKSLHNLSEHRFGCQFIPSGMGLAQLLIPGKGSQNGADAACRAELEMCALKTDDGLREMMLALCQVVQRSRFFFPKLLSMLWSLYTCLNRIGLGVLTELTRNEFCYEWIWCQENAREVTAVKLSVYKKDTFLFGHCKWVMRELNIFFSLYVYMKFLEIIGRILYMARFSQRQ